MDSHPRRAFLFSFFMPYRFSGTVHLRTYGTPYADEERRGKEREKESRD